jgi:hypothetical protein
MPEKSWSADRSRSRKEENYSFNLNVWRLGWRDKRRCHEFYGTGLYQLSQPLVLTFSLNKSVTLHYRLK